MASLDPDLCAQCGSQFPPGQVCNRHDDWVLARAAVILRNRSSKPDGIWARATFKVLSGEAEKIRRETPLPNGAEDPRIQFLPGSPEAAEYLGTDYWLGSDGERHAYVREPPPS